MCKSKDPEVVAYVVTNSSNIDIKGFCYELGRTYKTDNWVKAFESRLSPDSKYFDSDSKLFKVLLSGRISKSLRCNNIRSTEITVLEEIIDINKEMTAEWWKNTGVTNYMTFNEGHALVRNSKGLWNFIDKDCNYLFSEWLDYKWVCDFSEGLAAVQRSDKMWNFINKQGNLLSDEWFYEVENFSEGYALVQRATGEYNFLSKDCKFLLEDTSRFTNIYSFQNNFAIVSGPNELLNFITSDGTLLSDEWFDSVTNFNNEGYASVERSNGETFLIGINGKLYENYSDLYKHLNSKI